MLIEIRSMYVMNVTLPFSGLISPILQTRSLPRLSRPVTHSLQICGKQAYISIRLSYLPIYIWKPVSSSVRIACTTRLRSISVYLDVL